MVDLFLSTIVCYPGNFPMDETIEGRINFCFNSFSVAVDFLVCGGDHDEVVAGDYEEVDDAGGGLNDGLAFEPASAQEAD